MKFHPNILSINLSPQVNNEEYPFGNRDFRKNRRGNELIRDGNRLRFGYKSSDLDVLV